MIHPPLAEELARLLKSAAENRIDAKILGSDIAKTLLVDPAFLRLAARVVLEKAPKWGKPQSTYDYLRAVAEGGTL